MQLPLQITSRKVALTESAEEVIKQKARKLETFYKNVMGCRVMVEAPHRHKHQGVLYNVRIDLTVPGDELVVKREPHEDINVAIRDAFDAARRQLLAYSRKRRGEVKRRHEDELARAQWLAATVAEEEAEAEELAYEFDLDEAAGGAAESYPGAASVY
jgi:ribosomal subunit interface protein